MFDHEEPKVIHKRLCVVDIFVPSQNQHPDQLFELLASASFGTVQDDILTADGIRALTFGLHTVYLKIETCEKSTVERSGRYRANPIVREYEETSTDTANSDREGAGGVRFSIPFLRSFSAEGDATAKASKASKTAIQSSMKTSTTEYEIEPQGFPLWRLRALDPGRREQRLDGSELHEVPLCQINTPEVEATVTATLFIQSSDLWLATQSKTGTALEDEANRNAVLAALASKSLDDQSPNDFGPDHPEGEVVLAQSTLHRRPPVSEDPA